MKILLLSNYEYDQQNSMQLFARMLETGLAARGHEVRLIRPEPFFGRIMPSRQGIGKWLGYLDKFLLFPIKLHSYLKWADIVHICDHSNAHYVKYLRDIPNIVTCNDMLAIRSALGEFEQNPTGWTGRQLQRIITNGLKQARRIVCISRATRDDLLRITGIAPEGVSVIYMGLNYNYAPMNKDAAAQLVKSLGVDTGVPFMLHVGKDNWYKNRLGALRIFRVFAERMGGPKYNFVFAGASLSKKMEEFIRSEDLEGRVFAVTGLDQEDLQALYSSAAALVFPSIAEGFGWPIIEAQACGCPVFISNRAPMTEVGEKAAVYIDPEKPDEAARTVTLNLKNADRIRHAGLENVKRFSGTRMVDAYIEAYKEIIEKRQGS